MFSIRDNGTDLSRVHTVVPDEERFWVRYGVGDKSSMIHAMNRLQGYNKDKTTWYTDAAHYRWWRGKKGCNDTTGARLE